MKTSINLISGLALVNLLRSVHLIFFAVLIWPSCTLANNQTAGELSERLSQYENAALLLTESDGSVVYAFNENQPMVPASTVKLLTGLMSLEQWGAEHRIETNFYFDVENGLLRIVGSGDPFLVSEEISILAQQLKISLDSLSPDLPAGNAIKSVVVDHSLFENLTGLPWQSATSNPYDAVPAALAANFNTLNLKIENDRPVSAEEQTPLTRFSLAQATKIGPVHSIGRINTGTGVDDAARYFGELLATFLWHEGASFVDGSGKRHSRSDEPAMKAESVRLLLAEQVSVVSGLSSKPELKQTEQLIYTHRNTRSLGDIVAAMLQYSTNFIANNLALMLASEESGSPTDFAEFKALAGRYVQQRFGWKNTVLHEGAGLSVANRLSAKQLVELVAVYNQWPGLMPAYKKAVFDDSVFAKTGSLAGISTLAGTVTGDNGHENRFAILLMDSRITDSQARDKVLSNLKELVDAMP